MSIRIKIKNAETGASVEMDLEADNTIEETIESIASYWNMIPGAYVLRKGKKMLRGNQMITDAGLINEDVLELIPDPEGGSRPF